MWRRPENEARVRCYKRRVPDKGLWSMAYRVKILLNSMNFRIQSQYPYKKTGTIRQLCLSVISMCNASVERRSSRGSLKQGV